MIMNTMTMDQEPGQLLAQGVEEDVKNGNLEEALIASPPTHSQWEREEKENSSMDGVTRGEASQISREEEAQKREQYWSRVLTGDPETVPAEVRTRAGADRLDEPEEERNYDLMTSLNRSWVVDHLGVGKEETLTHWGSLRADLARKLDVADDEHEVFTALSQEQADRPLRELARQTYAQAYEQALLGKKETPITADGMGEELSQGIRSIAAQATREGAAHRERLLPLSRRLASGMDAILAAERNPGMGIFPNWRVAAATPDLLMACNELADMEDQERARVYHIAAEMASHRYPKDKGTVSTAFRAIGRGIEDMKNGIFQAEGNFAAMLLSNAGWALREKKDGIWTRASAALDRRLRVSEEVRKLAQQEIQPLELEKDASAAERYLVDAAGAVPAAVAANCGGGGFAALTLSGVGQAVAEARQRAPEGSLHLQMAAGLIGGALQAGIYVGMSRVGGRLLEQNIARFARAKGMKGYSLASLKGLKDLSIENAKLLLAGKAAESASLGLQELAARLEDKSSHINWKEYGKNLMDLDANLRQSAMNLPLILIGSGRAALRHFRSSKQVLGDGSRLLDWGIEERVKDAIMAEPNLFRKGEMLREALSGSRRWSGVNFIEEAWKSLRLLNDEHGEPFKDAASVRDFLSLPPAGERVSRMEVKELSLPAPEPLAEQPQSRSQTLSSSKKQLPLALRMWDEWYQKANAPLLSSQKVSPTIPDGKRMLRSYQELSTQKLPAVAAERKAAPLFSPYETPARQELLQECVDWAQRFSYRFLTNTCTVDVLSRQRGSEATMRQDAEGLRQSLLGEVGKSVLRSVMGIPRSEATGSIADFMSGHYNKLLGQEMGNEWLKKVPDSSITHMRELAFLGREGLNKQDLPEYREVLDQVVGLSHCSEMLYRLLPQTEEFQAALGQGMTHLQAYAYMLEKHLGYDPRLVKDYPQIEPLSPVSEKEATRNQEIFERYRKLTGHGLEKVQGEDGGEYWHVLLPDGRYTHWHRDPSDAIRELISQAALVFMPYAEGQPVYGKSTGNSDSRTTFSGFEQLNSVALEDLHSFWKSNAGRAQLGLDLQRMRQIMRGLYRGDGVTPLIYDTPQKGSHYTVDLFSVASPMAMLQAHFLVYWRRMLNSGWVSVEDAGNYLLKQGYLTKEQLDQIIEIGAQKPAPSGPNIPLNTPPPPRDIYGMQMAMADQMGRFFADCCLSDMQRSPLPQSVKAWFALAPFYTPDEATRKHYVKNPTVLSGDETRGLRRWGNHHTALKFQSFADHLEQMRNRLPGADDAFFQEHWKMALGDDSRQNQEQAWCYHQAGREVLHSVSQSHWNMMRSPGRAWELMTEEERQDLRNNVESICRQEAPPQYWEDEARGEAGDVVESAIRNLDEVLKDYPELHQYSLDHENRLWRLTLEKELPKIRFSEPAPWPEPEPSELGGYRVERLNEMPSFLEEDSRVLPALALLDAMRSYVTDIPYPTWGGIVWKGRVYGGLHGLKPPTIDRLWETHEPMKGVLDLLGLYKALGKPIQNCGVEVPGLSLSDLNHRILDNITIYRDIEDPLRSFRLMPGDLESAQPAARHPYLIHSIAGSFLRVRRMVRDESDLREIYRPLKGFRRTKGYNLAPEHEHYCSRINIENVLSKLITFDRSALVEHEQPKSMEPMDELMMRLFEDTGFSLSLERIMPENLTPGQMQALKLARAMLLATYGVNTEESYKPLGEFCRELRESPKKKELLIDTLSHSREGYHGRMKEYEEERELQPPPEPLTPEQLKSRRGRKPSKDFPSWKATYGLNYRRKQKEKKKSGWR